MRADSLRTGAYYHGQTATIIDDYSGLARETAKNEFTAGLDRAAGAESNTEA